MPRKSEYIECFYCEGLLGEHVEKDHIPTPKWLGGENVVMSCQSCHDMKDRFNLEDFPLGWIEPVMRDWVLLARESRIVMMKIFRLACEAKEIIDNGVNGIVEAETDEEVLITEPSLSKTELERWEEIKSSNKISDFQEFLHDYPEGVMGRRASREIDKLMQLTLF